MEVRTRFAPSPTGFLHIGGLRSAAFAWLLARRHGGQFILRIEDTDQTRKVPGAIKYILDCFNWIGIDIDEGPSLADLKKIGEETDGLPDLGGAYGPYIQSLRLPLYQDAAEKLIESGHAFRCDCTPEMLEQERNEQMARREAPGYSGYCRTRNVSKDTQHVIRFKMPVKPNLSAIDAVKGRVSWESIPIKDPVILKSDGFPTYHSAVVVDDHNMKITHAMRGDEWIASFPLHLLIYEALGWEPPIFAHLPVILATDGKKLGKRHGSVAIDAFKSDGYLPDALFNYMMLVGWSPGEGSEQEVFSKEELKKIFSLERVNNASGVFDYEKLKWLNGQYIRKLTSEEFTELVLPYIEKSGLKLDINKWQLIAPFIRDRIRMLDEVPGMIEFMCVDNLKRDIHEMFNKKFSKADAINSIKEASNLIAGLEDFSVAKLDLELKALSEKLNYKVGAMFVCLRIAVLGKKATPPLFESFVALGKDETLKRLDQALVELENFSE